MANFEVSYNRVMNHEGLYSNDPIDKGGETYKGISRRYHPDWEGWIVIEEYKGKGNFPHSLSEDLYLESMVMEFYDRNYWDKFWGDEIECQEVADEMLDISINMGIRTSVIFLQRALNLLNRNQSNYINIEEDGLFGRITLKTLNSKLPNKDFFMLLKLLNILQGCHYIEIASRDESQERFMRGWLNRIELNRKI